MQDIALIIAVVGGLIFLAHLFLHIFNRTRVPDVLLLIVVGIILGPASNLVPIESFGLVGPILVTVTLVVILFEGGIALKLSALKSALSKAVKLAVTSFFLTMIVVGVTAHLLLSLEWIPSLIIGSIAASTSEAIIIPLINQLKTSEKMHALLSVESSVNDVLSVAVTLALIGAYQLGDINVGMITGDLIASFLVAIVFGFGGAFLWSLMLRRIHTMKNAMFTTVAIVFALFGLVETLGFSGAIAALAFGITIGNIESIKLPKLGKPLAGKPVGLSKTEKAFFTEASFLLKTFFFIYLGISLQFSSTGIILIGVLITFIAFALRIPAVRIAVGRSVSTKEAALMAVMIPKGLAAAVLASIPAQAGIIGGELIRDVTYMVILISIVATSVMIPLLERTRVSDFYENIVSGNMRNLRKARSINLVAPSKSNGYIKRLKEDGKITPTGDKMFGDSKKD
jgi:NhaP-type Na+/H+ or K+/H+ antiporter